MLSFFQGLLDVILQIGNFFLPFSVLHEYENGVLLRFGRYHNDLGPGWVWHWPCGIDDVLKVNVAFDTTSLTEQVVTSRDGVGILIQMAVGYRITDTKKFLIDVEDTDTVVVDATAGILQAMVNAEDWDEIRQPSFQDEVYKAARKRAFRFGVTIENCYFKSLARMGLREGVLYLAQ